MLELDACLSANGTFSLFELAEIEYRRERGYVYNDYDASNCPVALSFFNAQIGPSSLFKKNISFQPSKALPGLTFRPNIRYPTYTIHPAKKNPNEAHPAIAGVPKFQLYMT